METQKRGRGRPRIEPTDSVRRTVARALETGETVRIPTGGVEPVEVRHTKLMLRRAADEIPARLRITHFEDCFCFTVKQIGKAAA